MTTERRITVRLDKDMSSKLNELTGYFAAYVKGWTTSDTLRYLIELVHSHKRHELMSKKKVHHRGE
jgi:hypothetical protein